MISWTSLKMCYVGWKTRSVGEILEKPSVWMTLRKKPFENIHWNEKMLVSSIFSLFHNVFDPFERPVPELDPRIICFMQKVQTDEFKILLFGNTYISQDVGNWLCLVKRLRWATPGPSWPSCLEKTSRYFQSLSIIIFYVMVCVVVLPKLLYIIHNLNMITSKLDKLFLVGNFKLCD